ncbi:MAG: tyrosine-type recombinase/integrase [Alphaproteobacteria bacterium]|nr:tyrosine-type recombinase/integrase [Alphaproteobacteria bacterium]
MTDKPISPLRQRMIEDMTVRGYTRATQRAYITMIREFTKFFGRSPDQASADDLRRYQVHMRENGASDISMNAAVSALRFFFGTTLGRNDAQTGMTTVRVPKRVPVILSEDEVRRLLQAAAGLKYRAAFSLAYGAGLRASEVVGLKISDIDSAPDRMLLRIEQAKGRKDRYAKLSKPMLNLLKAWWKAGYASGVMLPGGWLFPGQNPVNHLTPRQLRRALDNAKQAAGIDKPMTLHTLRHCFASHLLDQGVDIRVIQVLLGHVKLETTARYVRVASSTLRSVKSPLDHLDLGPLPPD